VVRRVARWSRASLDVVDMDSDDELVRLYSLRVPVVLGPGDRVLAEGRIDPRQLRKAIAAERRARSVKG
jgi:hypothetical protein